MYVCTISDHDREQMFANAKELDKIDLNRIAYVHHSCGYVRMAHAVDFVTMRQRPMFELKEVGLIHITLPSVNPKATLPNSGQIE